MANQIGPQLTEPIRPATNEFGITQIADPLASQRYEPYGVSFPQNYGTPFTPKPVSPLKAGVPGVLDQLTQPEKPVSTFDFAPRINETGPNYVPTPSDDDDDIFKQFKPETKAQDEYLKMLENIPQRQQPSWTNRILGGLATADPRHGGPEAAERIKYGGYHREMEAFDKRANILKDLASTERAGNINERMILSQIASDRRFDRRQSEYERKNREQGDLAAKKAAFEQVKFLNPDSKPLRLGTGNWGLLDAQTNQIIDSGIKYGLSPLEDILMERQSTRERQQTQADIDKLRQEDAQAHAQEMARLEARLRNEAADQRSQRDQGELRLERFNKARALLNSDPGLSRYFRFGEPGTNDFEIIPPTLMPEWRRTFGTDVTGINKGLAQNYIRAVRTIYGPEWHIPKFITDLAEAKVEPPLSSNAPPSRASGAGPGTPPKVTAPDPAVVAARRKKAGDLLKSKKLQSDDKAIDTFLKQNPNFK